MNEDKIGFTCSTRLY